MSPNEPLVPSSPFHTVLKDGKGRNCLYPNPNKPREEKTSSAVVSSTADDRERLRAAAARLRPRLPNIDKLLRLGAVAMLERCEGWCAERAEMGDGMLAHLLLQGGPPAVQQPPRLSARERWVAERNWWMEGYREPRPS